MITKQAFRQAFLAELSSRNISKVEFVDSMLKAATADSTEKAASVSPEDVFDTLTKGIVAPALLAPFLTGWQIAKARRTSKADINAIRDMEMLKSYAQGIQDIKSTDALNASLKKKKDKKKPALKLAAAQPPVNSVRDNIAAVEAKTKGQPAPPPVVGAPPPPVPANKPPKTPVTEVQKVAAADKYLEGFIATCEEAGIDPNDLVKASAKWTAPLAVAGKIMSPVGRAEAMQAAGAVLKHPSNLINYNVPDVVSHTAELGEIGGGIAHGARGAHAAYKAGEGAGGIMRAVGGGAKHVVGLAGDAAGGTKPFLGTGLARVAGPAGAAAIGYDALSGAFRDPNTGEWNTNVGKNVTGMTDNMLEGSRREPGQSAAGQLLHNGWTGIDHPAQTIMAAGTGAAQTGSNLAEAAGGMGVKNTVRSLMGKRIPAPSAEEIAKARAAQTARQQAREIAQNRAAYTAAQPVAPANTATNNVMRASAPVGVR